MDKKAFSLAETLLVMAIVIVIGLMLVALLKTEDIGEKELLIQYHKTYADMEKIFEEIAMYNSDRAPIDVVSVGGMDYLYCRDVLDNSQCLKNIVLKRSNLQDCEDNNCMSNFAKILEGVHDLDPSFSSLDGFRMVKLPSGATLAMKYLDKSCTLKMPIYKKNGTVQTIANSCGLLVVDVNGNDAPNTYDPNETNTDVYLFALQKIGVKGSEQAIAEAVGCKYPEQEPDFESGGCVAIVKCPDGTESAMVGTNGAFKYKDMWGNYGYCKKSAKICNNGENASFCTCKSPMVNDGGICKNLCSNGDNTASCYCQSPMVVDGNICHTECPAGQSWNGNQCDIIGDCRYDANNHIAVARSYYRNGRINQNNLYYYWDNTKVYGYGVTGASTDVYTLVYCFDNNMIPTTTFSNYQCLSSEVTVGGYKYFMGTRAANNSVITNPQNGFYINFTGIADSMAVPNPYQICRIEI